jgi:hypothetical protein
MVLYTVLYLDNDWGHQLSLITTVNIECYYTTLHATSNPIGRKKSYNRIFLTPSEQFQNLIDKL